MPARKEQSGLEPRLSISKSPSPIQRFTALNSLWIPTFALQPRCPSWGGAGQTVHHIKDLGFGCSCTQLPSFYPYTTDCSGSLGLKHVLLGTGNDPDWRISCVKQENEQSKIFSSRQVHDRPWNYHFRIRPQLLRSGETCPTFLDFSLESLSGSIPPAWRCLGKRLKERGWGHGWGHVHCAKEVLQTSLCVYRCGQGEKSLYWKRVSESIWIHLVSIFIS